MPTETKPEKPRAGPMMQKPHFPENRVLKQGEVPPKKQ